MKIFYAHVVTPVDTDVEFPFEYESRNLLKNIEDSLIFEIELTKEQFAMALLEDNLDDYVEISDAGITFVLKTGVEFYENLIDFYEEVFYDLGITKIYNDGWV